MTDPIGAIGTIGAAIMRGRRPMIAPTCHDLAELIESDPATAWTWDREGECTALGGHDQKPACEPHEHKRRQFLSFTIKNLEAPE